MSFVLRIFQRTKLLNCHSNLKILRTSSGDLSRSSRLYSKCSSQELVFGKKDAVHESEYCLITKDTDSMIAIMNRKTFGMNKEHKSIDRLGSKDSSNCLNLFCFFSSKK